MKVSFRQNLLPEEGEVCREEEALFCGADRGGAEAGGDRSAGGGADPVSGDHGADTLSLEETVQGTGDRPGPAVQTTPGRERAAEAVSGRVDVGQSDAAGRAGKKTVTPAAPPGGELLARYLSGERAACMSCGADGGLDLPL